MSKSLSLNFETTESRDHFLAEYCNDDACCLEVSDCTVEVAFVNVPNDDEIKYIESFGCQIL
jgi:hypothetical protein